MTVTALLVSHDGARWLPSVLEGLAAQRHQPDRVIALDTGSSDQSVELLRAALGDDAVREAEATCSFPDAIDRLLKEVTTDWVWILHDDANPDPEALGALLAGAEEHDAAIAGPKLREWPSLRRLQEIGVTISATGRRETGLERGEYDQGQHDQVRQVLAVNTAGMLVRRDALATLRGFDHQLPLYGNDLDFGWRAARAGLRTVVVPSAVVFHAEAAHRGVRRSALSGRRTRTHRYEREAALYTLLVNRERWFVPSLLRLVVGTLLRVVGYLLARQPGHAGDEFAALVNTLVTLPRILRRRRGLAGSPGSADGLLAPWWVPYRHGLDLVVDFTSAAAVHGREAAERRKLARAERLGLPAPVPVDEDELADDSGLLARYLTSPAALAVTAAALLGLWAARIAFGPLEGGALSPAPSDAAAWRDLVFDGWHQLGQGTDAPAPGYLLPFSLAATVLFGSPAVVVSLLFLLAVPFAGWGAWRFLRALGELTSGQADTPVTIWGAIAYAAVPVASGAWGQGRFGIVVSAALLPWFAHVVIGLFETSADRRWRAAWRGGAILAVLTAFTPSAWLVAVLAVGVLLGLGFLLARDVVTSADVWAPLVVVLAVPVALMLPGAVGMIGHDPAALFLEAGRLSPTPGALDLVAGRLGGTGAPIWAGLLLLAPGLVAVLRRRTRVSVLACWILVAVAAVLAAILSHVTVELPAGPVRPGLGFLVVVVQAALLTGVVLAAQGLRPGRLPLHAWTVAVRRAGGRVARTARAVVARISRLRELRPRSFRATLPKPASFAPKAIVAGALRPFALLWAKVRGIDWKAVPWQSPVGVAAAVAGLLVPLVGLGWWVLDGEGELHRPTASEVPAYMIQAGDRGLGHGVLVIRGDVREGITWEVHRGDGTTLGEDEILALTGPDPGLQKAVTTLVSRATPEVLDTLTAGGIDYVLLPAPASVQVASVLDAADGLAQASAPSPRTRAWQLEKAAAPDAVAGDNPWWHRLLVGLQLIAILVVAVLCGPTRREEEA